jgi:tetrahydromethanopterin S-methyltransferase subunit H
MKGEKLADASTKTHGSSKMSDFFRYGSVEERRAVYQMAATVAISEQKDVIRSAKNDEFSIAKCK